MIFFIVNICLINILYKAEFILQNFRKGIDSYSAFILVTTIIKGCQN